MSLKLLSNDLSEHGTTLGCPEERWVIRPGNWWEALLEDSKGPGGC